VKEGKMEIIINAKGIGENGFWSLRNQLNSFVKKNFSILYEGACRLGCNIPGDYYAPNRVQINRTRLHAYIGLKYASGHKYSDDTAPTEEELREAVADIQLLLDKAAETIPAPFTLKVEENRV
jgi:hypothetical protein